MLRLSAYAYILKGAAICALSASAAVALELESGLKPVLSEVLVDNMGDETWLRFRFVSDQIDPSTTGMLSFADVESDMHSLCAGLAVPYMKKYALSADKVVVSLSDRIVEHGIADPDATQFFEQFRLEQGRCIWEAF